MSYIILDNIVYELNQIAFFFVLRLIVLYKSFRCFLYLLPFIVILYKCGFVFLTK